MQGNAGNPAERVKAMTRAFELRDRVSEKERRRIEGMYYYYVTREMNKAVAAFQLWISASPRESLPHNMLGNVHRQAGEFEEAVRAYKEGIRVQPHYEVAYSNLMGVHILIEQFEEAKAVAQQAFAQKLDAPPIHRLLLQIAYIQGDSAGVEKEIQWFKGKPEEYLSLKRHGAGSAA
jgi:tetratricopeptide (TPR) repeat protein